jgi:hypothetical protein
VDQLSSDLDTRQHEPSDPMVKSSPRRLFKKEGFKIARNKWATGNHVREKSHFSVIKVAPDSPYRGFRHASLFNEARHFVNGV